MQFQNELPPAKTVRAEPIDWAQAKADLIANEGQWGKMVENVASSTTQQLRAGKNAAFRGDELAHFEFATRKPKDAVDYKPRRTDLWGRYTKDVKK